MKILVAGGTGAIGKFLLPLLLENKHEVVALTRSVTKAPLLEDSGVSAIIVDPLNKPRLTAAVRRTSRRRKRRAKGSTRATAAHRDSARSIAQDVVDHAARSFAVNSGTTRRPSFSERNAASMIAITDAPCSGGTGFGARPSNASRNAT